MSNQILPLKTKLSALLANIASKIDTKKAGDWTPSVADVPDLPASKVTSGTFAVARIPTLNAYLSTSGGSVSGITTFTNTQNAGSSSSGSLRTSGGLGVALDIYAGGNITAYSDIRVKKDLKKIDDPLSKLKQVTGYTYTRTDTGDVQAGLIAQDVQKVLPEVVKGDFPMGIAYGNFSALIVEAVKELASNHETEIALLKEEIKELKSLLERK